jgi:hypothetical protein
MTFTIKVHHRKMVVCIGPEHGYHRAFGSVKSSRLQSFFLGRHFTIVTIR